MTGSPVDRWIVASLFLAPAGDKTCCVVGSYASWAAGGAALRRWHRQQARDTAPADVVDPGIHHVVALDFNHDWRADEALAVEFAERHCKVGYVAVPADGEIGAKCDLRPPVRPAYGDIPLVSRRRSYMPLVKLLAQAVGSLLECQSPVIEHVAVVGAAHGAGDMVEMGVLIGVQADHFAKRQQQAEREHGESRRLPAAAVFFQPAHS